MSSGTDDEVDKTLEDGHDSEPSEAKAELATSESESTDSSESDGNANDVPEIEPNEKPEDATSAEEQVSDETESSDSDEKPIDKKAKIIGGVIAAVIVLLIGISLLPCRHDWQEATCTEPKTCKKCKETEGEPLGHDYAEATCTEPKTCKRCGETVGSALGHEVGEWTIVKEATCSSTGISEGVCTRCGEKQTKSLPKLDHTPGDWEITTPSTVSSDGSITAGVRTRSCTVCGGVIDTETYRLEATTSQRNALRKAQSYLNTMAFSHRGLVEQLEYEGYSTDDATFAADNCGADWNVQAERKAQSYLSLMGFSHSGLVDQLEYEGFTTEQAEHGVSAAGL